MLLLNLSCGGIGPASYGAAETLNLDSRSLRAHWFRGAVTVACGTSRALASARPLRGIQAIQNQAHYDRSAVMTVQTSSIGTAPAQQQDIPLVVDLDGTLIRTDSCRNRRSR